MGLSHLGVELVGPTVLSLASCGSAPHLGGPSVMVKD